MIEMQSPDPLVKPTPIADLRPTQITVGMRETAAKRQLWRQVHRKDAGEFLGRHMIPVVLGPKNRPYVIDHHHLAFALHQEKVKNVLVTVVSDMSHLSKDAFWVVLDNRGWMHPFDDKGVRRPYSAIPDAIRDLIDDPFRSLAGALRDAGGYAKDMTPFSEFLWADFMRRRIKRSVVENDFERALKIALTAAKSLDARYLPGWCAPQDRT
jgi:hypothetical protein